MIFSDLLQLPVACDLITGKTGAVLVMGDRRGEIAISSKEARRGVAARVFFGLPVHTSPAPVLMRSLLTERGARFDDFSLFAWIEENYLAQPRADIVGLMPNGVQPLFFLRDLDLDLPPEAYVREGEAWARVRGVVVVRESQGSERSKRSDPFSLALRYALPNEQKLVDELQAAARDNASLRAAIRARRKIHPPEVLRVCDAWRVLAQAAPLLACDPSDPKAILSLGETFMAL
ncbi:MAG TPA: hypothetical protein PLW39_06285 [Thermoflexales bacterium]|nr:hypothetical protein [Thermoflexales bacterium]